MPTTIVTGELTDNDFTQGTNKHLQLTDSKLVHQTKQIVAHYNKLAKIIRPKLFVVVSGEVRIGRERCIIIDYLACEVLYNRKLVIKDIDNTYHQVHVLSNKTTYFLAIP